MQIKKIAITNYRAIKHTEADVDSMTGFIGRNGAGKSSILSAIQLFYDLSSKISIEDFYNRETQNNIEIGITFHRLRDSEIQLFSSYLKNQELSVRKVIAWNGSSVELAYYGTARQIEAFAEVRSIQLKNDKKKKWNDLVESGVLPGLRAFSRADDIDPFMAEFERGHPELLAEVDTNFQFFGSTNVGGGRLDNFTKIVHIPAVKDATDEAINKRGAIAQLLDIIVKRQVESKPEVIELKREFEEKIKRVYSADTLSELPELAQSITETLVQYAPGTELRLQWQEVVPPKLPLPDALASVVEDGFDSEIGRKGHGLQRVLILTLLQYLASIPIPRLQTEGDLAGEVSDDEFDIILTIEEPELYQHPLKSRYLSNIFAKLSKWVQNQSNMQILYTSHSPYFVGLERYEEIRVVKKQGCPEGCGYETIINAFSKNRMLSAVREIEDDPSRQLSGDGFIVRAIPVMTTIVNEGFFADYAIVVEGNTEISVLWAVHDHLGKDWHKKGIAIIPAYGKNNLDRPVIIFRGLGIPVFFVFDADKKKTETRPDMKAETARRNRRLLRLAGEQPVDHPVTQIGAKYAVFEDMIETTIQDDVGEASFNRIRDAVASELDLSRPTEVLKNSLAATLFVNKLYEDGLVLPSIEAVVNRIDEFAESR
jgi:predicted ATP-dependent endonuclease of OLD family